MKVMCQLLFSCKKKKQNKPFSFFINNTLTCFVSKIGEEKGKKIQNVCWSRLNLTKQYECF